MRFRQHDNLRTFTLVARHESLTAAAEALNLTKGAVSHQIRKLEEALGFALLIRSQKGISLTGQGEDLCAAAQSSFNELERTIERLRNTGKSSVTLAVSSYFASRWLSPRLMHFMKAHPDIRLKIQPMVDLQELDDSSIDLVIRWGNGDWDDGAVKCLFLCPAFATGPRGINQKIETEGLANQTLLRDWKHSTAWREWHEVGGFVFKRRKDSLIIPDPNVRVQAVIDGQGIGINDRLTKPELESGMLERIFDHALEDYGYFLVQMPGSERNPAAMVFTDWLFDESETETA